MYPSSYSTFPTDTADRALHHFAWHGIKPCTQTCLNSSLRGVRKCMCRHYMLVLAVVMTRTSHRAQKCDAGLSLRQPQAANVMSAMTAHLMCSQVCLQDSYSLFCSTSDRHLAQWLTAASLPITKLPWHPPWHDSERLTAALEVRVIPAPVRPCSYTSDVTLYSARDQVHRSP